MANVFSNQATAKYLGYVYQVLIAIESYFNSAPNQTIFLECYGDISYGTTTTEIKHHIGPHNLGSNSQEFWKTLYNFLKEDTDRFQDFILHTTSNIPTISIFFGWNDKSIKQKYSTLRQHSPVETIKKYYDFILSEELKDKLHKVLEKFTIKSSQESIENKWNSLLKARNLNLLGDYKEDALHWLYGQFNAQAIVENKIWQINVNDMDKKLKLFSDNYRGEKIQFPFVSKSELTNEIKDYQFPFIDELEKIEIKKVTILTAVSEYCRSKESYIKLIHKYADTLSNILDNHDEAILDRLINKKQQYSDNISKEQIYGRDAINLSKKLYHHCINDLETINIPNINDTQRYYQNGRIHNSVNEAKFSWIFNEEDVL